MRALIIDDGREYLRSIKRAVGLEELVAVECHSVSDALNAIQEHKPEILFLDNYLTEGSGKGEGLEILDRIKDMGIKVYSTTTSEAAAAKYELRGIERVRKSDFRTMRLIINSVKGA